MLGANCGPPPNSLPYRTTLAPQIRPSGTALRKARRASDSRTHKERGLNSDATAREHCDGPSGRRSHRSNA